MRLLIALTLASLLAVAGPAEAKTQKPCARKGSHTVKTTKLVRVYEVANADGGNNLFGCLRSNNRRRLLAKGYDDGLVTSGVYDHVRVAGRFVAWQYTATDISCKADCPPGYDPTTVHLTVRDLRKRKNVTVDGDLADEGGKLVLTKGGAIAWSEDDPFAIKAFDGGGARTLDSGDNLDLSSLRLVNGNTARWLNGGQPSTAKLASRS